MTHALADPGAFPPSERLNVISMASASPEAHQSPDTRWSLDELALRLVNQAAAEAMSRCTIWRVLQECDLRPHKSVYWLNSHDPDFNTKASDICRIYLDAPRLYQEAQLVICADEKTGMQILKRKHPTRPAQPRMVEKREFEYIRHGTRSLLASFNVATGELTWDLGQTRTALDWVSHLRHVVKRYPDQKKYHWVVDNLNTHWHLEVCRQVALWEGINLDERTLAKRAQRRAFLQCPSHRHVFHFTPIHGSWLNQVELFFSVLARRFLKRGDFASAEEFERRIGEWLDEYNRRAHPYRWTYAGEPLVRATPFSQTARQRRRGRSFFGTRPQLFERLIHPTRSYHRRQRPLATNL